MTPGITPLESLAPPRSPDASRPVRAEERDGDAFEAELGRVRAEAKEKAELARREREEDEEEKEDERERSERPSAAAAPLAGRPADLTLKAVLALGSVRVLDRAAAGPADGAVAPGAAQPGDATGDAGRAADGRATRRADGTGNPGPRAGADARGAKAAPEDGAPAGETTVFAEARARALTRLARGAEAGGDASAVLDPPSGDLPQRQATEEVRRQERVEDRTVARRDAAAERAAAPAGASSGADDASTGPRQDGASSRAPLGSATPSSAATAAASRGADLPPAGPETRASTPASAPSVAPAAAPPAPTPDLSAHRANPAGSMPPSTGPAVPTPIDAILRQVRSKVSAGVRELEIRLDPKELGRIDLRFLMRGESLHVTVRATSTEVVNALRHDLAAFEQTLKDAGIDLSSLDIDLGREDGHEAAGASDDRLDARADTTDDTPRRTSARRAPDEDEWSLDAPPPSPDDGRIDVTA